MSQSRLRFSRSSTAAIVAMAIGVALVALAVAFDWNWFRPRLEQYLAEKSQRSVRIGDLHVSLSPSLDPTLRMRGVQIANAASAGSAGHSSMPGKLRATFLLSSLIDKRPVISHLVVIDADIDLERQADGLRNWRLVHPDDRGPTRIRLMSIEAVRSRIRFAHRGLGLDLQTAASPVEAAEAPWTTRVAFEGTYRDAAFSGEALTGPELTFLDTGRPFPLRGQVVSNGARLDVDGQATDLFTLAGIDAKVALRTPSLASLKPWLGKPLPTSPPVEIGGRLTKAADAMSMADLTAKIGATRFAGSVSYDRSVEPRRFRADINSRAVRVEDLRWTTALARALVAAADARSPTSQPIRAPRQAIGPSPVQPPHPPAPMRRAATVSTPSSGSRPIACRPQHGRRHRHSI